MLQPLPLRSRRKGATIVEFTLVCVVFFLFLFGILEYARFIFAQNLLNNVAREGARFAVTHTTTATTTQVQNYVDGYLGSHGASTMVNYNKTTSITVFQANPTTGKDNSGGWTNTSQGMPLGVSISGTYNPLLPRFLFMGQTLTISGTAVMYSETS